MLKRLKQLAFSPAARLTIRSWAAYAALPLVGIVTAPLLARSLGPDGRGQLAAVLQPLSVADAFVAFGVPAAVTFYVARGASVPAIRKHAHRLLLASSVITGLVLFLYSERISTVTGLPRAWIVATWMSTILGAFIAARRGMWQGFQQFKIIDAERSSAAATRLLFIVTLSIVGVASALFFAGAYVISGLLAATLLWRKLPSSPFGRRFRRSRSPGKSFVKYSLLASLGTIAMTLNNRLDQAVLPAAVSARELGFYSVAVTVAEVPVIISTVMARNLLAETGSRSGRKAILRTAMIGILGVTFSCAVLAALVPWLIPFVFGKDYSSSVGLAQLLLFGTVLGTISMAMSIILTGNGWPGLGSFGPAASAACTALLLWIWWGVLTVEGAALISIAAQAISCVVTGCILFSNGQCAAKKTKILTSAI